MKAMTLGAKVSRHGGPMDAWADGARLCAARRGVRTSGAAGTAAQLIRKNLGLSSSFAYELGVPSLEQFIDSQLASGRAYFAREEALAALGLKPEALSAAITRLVKKRRLANPRHGFCLILRPEDQGCRRA